MNARVALLQIASQQLKQCRNGGGRMPRNPRPDQIGMGGRILSVQVAGSPRNTHTVLVSKRLEKALIAFASTYPRHITNPNAALFFSAKRGGFSAQTIVNLFARFYALAGIKGASSHSGRRQFLTELADKGINVRVIQALARHKDMSTTQRYIDYNESKLRNAIELA
jgi:site-specific recombinase XerD